MKHASITLVALTFSLSGLFMACASGNTETGVGGFGGSSGNTTVGTTTSTGPGATTSVTTAATTTTTTATGGGQCPSSCMSDADCQSSCPGQGPNASNCCDTQTNICYVSNTAQCPAPNPTTTGAGGSMY